MKGLVEKIKNIENIGKVEEFKNSILVSDDLSYVVFIKKIKDAYDINTTYKQLENKEMVKSKKIVMQIIELCLDNKK